MTINDNAVEAVAKVLVEDGAYGVPWGDASDDDRAEAMRKARTLLEPAAPHLVAEAVADILEGMREWSGEKELGFIEGYADAVSDEIERSAEAHQVIPDEAVEVLRKAADALEAQPPMLRAQYVSTLRLYASEPWRLETCPSECAATHPGKEHAV